MHLLALSLVLPVLAATTLAQEPAARPAEKPAAKAPFVFEPGVVELRTVIERCGTYLQRNILVDDSELSVASGQPRARQQRPAAPAAAAPAAADPQVGPFVELQLPVVTDRDGCEELLTSLLWTRGLTMVPLDEAKGVYEVLAVNGARGREVLARAVQRTPEQVLARPTLRQHVTVVYRMKHTNATIATNALRPFFASSGQSNSNQLTLGNVGNSASILISGPQDQVANLLQVLATADVPLPPELRSEVDVRVDALAKQNEQLARRLAALEEKLAEKKQ